MHAGAPHPEGYISEEEQREIEVFVEDATTGLDMELGSLEQGSSALHADAPEQAAAAQGGFLTRVCVDCTCGKSCRPLSGHVMMPHAAGIRLTSVLYAFRFYKCKNRCTAQLTSANSSPCP